jgi:ATP-dependent DNA helicase RecG
MLKSQTMRSESSAFFVLRPLTPGKLSDLNRSSFENDYLPNAFAPDVLEQNHRSYEERLSACRMIDATESAMPTVLGAIVLGNRPRDLLPCAYLQFLRFDGTDLAAPIIDEASIDGRVAQIIERIDDKFRAHNTTRVDLVSQDKEVRHSDYPLGALQQLVRNAVMHRSYEATNAPVRIDWFKDRIEILNPGGPYGLVNSTNFGQAGVTDYRNPHLAEAMKVLGIVQRFGVGISTARRLLADNGNPPLEFETTGSHVRVIVRKGT